MDNWDAHEPIGSRVWLMVPKWDTVDFAEEAAFVLSLAQDLIEPQEERFEVGLVSMCGADAVVVKAIVERPLIDALKQGKLGEARKLICTHNALKMVVSKEFRVIDRQDRSACVEALIGLANAIHHGYMQVDVNT
jgi:hypothetical protein